MFSNGGFSSPDIWIVIAINSTAFVSILLNPLVFRHNYYKKRSIARDLYMALSTTDFISCIILPITFSIRILRPKEGLCMEQNNSTFCQNEYLRYARRATSTEKAVGVLTWYLISSPMLITSVLAICRWYQVKYPLRPVSKASVKVLVAALCCFSGIYHTILLFADNFEGPTLMMIRTLSVYNYKPFGLEVKHLFVSFVSAMIIPCLSNIASVSTIWNIVRSETVPGSSERRKRSKKMISTLKIALLNVGNMLFMGVIISATATMKYSSAADDRNHYLLMAIASCFSPILISTYNPVIYILLTTGILTNNSRVGKN